MSNSFINGGGGSGDSGSGDGPRPFIPLNDGFGILPAGPCPNFEGDIHDTFKVDKLGDITEGHTTVRIPGGQEIRLIDW